MRRDTVSEEIINSFVDRQLGEEDNLEIIDRANRDKRLVREIRVRRRLKALVTLAYTVLPPAEFTPCPERARRWWW